MVVIVVFQRGLLTGLRGMDGIRRDLFAAMLFLLLHFFVVRDIAWISHVTTMCRPSSHRGRTARRASARFFRIDLIPAATLCDVERLISRIHQCVAL